MEKQNGFEVRHVEADGVSHSSRKDEEKVDNKPIKQDAHQGVIDEKDLSVRDAIKAYPKAILWSLVFSTCVIMEGYDTNLLGNFFAYRKCQIDM
jgi:SP family general alpha glucoside:H+ symporter-like MFS transporter